jgi:3'-phosphoadenosine 5'-phosphosulfate sulfotransferase (PAPS reductase)/FAD synthetase
MVDMLNPLSPPPVGLTEKLVAARTILSRGLALNPAHVFLLLSGGNDSASVTHFVATELRRANRPFRIVHINTGIGIPETREHVNLLCFRYRWQLIELRAKEDCGQDYEKIVMQHGFPGPSQHPFMYRLLKERPLRKLARDVEGTLMLISGARLNESARRMRLVSGDTHREGRRIWCAPFYHLTNDDVVSYMEAEGVPESPVRQKLCMSGECLCGAYARPHELKEVTFFYPATGARLAALQARVRAAGFPWNWDEKAPPWWGRMRSAEKAGQADAFEAERNEIVTRMMLCGSCEARQERGER